MRQLFCLLATLLLLAPSASSAADRDEYAAIHSVAVVSAIGDSLFFENDGPLSGDHIEPLDISAWGIDSWVKQKVTEALAPRFSVQPLEVDATAVKGCTLPGQCASDLPHTDSVDAYVLVFKTWAPNPITGMGDVAGLGLLYHPGIFGIGTFYAIHSVYGVAIIDARTGKVVDHGTARTDEHNTPAEIAPADLWPEHPPEMTAEQQNKAKEIIMRQIDKTLLHALRNANLIAGSN